MKSEYKIEGHGKRGKRTYFVYLRNEDGNREYVTNKASGERERFTHKNAASAWALRLNAMFGLGDFAG